MKTAYHYDHKTFLFAGISNVHIDDGYDSPMLPQCATWTETPDFDANTERLKFDVAAQKWGVEDKLVEVTAYHKKTQQTKQFDDKTLITDDYTIKEPLPYSEWQNADDNWVQQISLLRDAKHQQINYWRDTQETDDTAIVEANGSRWDADPKARKRINSVLLSGQMPAYWTDADDVDHHGMTLDQLKKVKYAIGERGFKIHDRQRTMKKEIAAITDFDALEQYSIDWPEP